MKIKSGFMVREIMDEYVIVPMGEQALRFSGMISVNEVGAFLWQLLTEERTEEELTAAVLEEFEIDEQTAKQDIKEFVQSLKKHQLLEE